MDEREKKLPVWCRDELRSLRSQIKDLTERVQLLEMKTPDGSTGKVSFHSGINTRRIILPDRAWVEFKLPDGVIGCMLREEGTILDINSHQGALHILPRAANCAHLKLVR